MRFKDAQTKLSIIASWDAELVAIAIKYDLTIVKTYVKQFTVTGIFTVLKQ